MVLDDVFESFVVFGKKKGFENLRRKLFERIVRRSEGRVQTMHVLKKFALATGCYRLGEYRKSSILLESLKEIVSCGCENFVDQVDDSV